MYYVQIKKLPSYIQSYTLTSFTKYNYVFLFSRFGFLKYKFNKKYLEVIVKQDKIKIGGSNFELFKTYSTILETICLGIKYQYSYWIKIIGLGFKYKLVKNRLYLILGYSHLIKIIIPKNLYLLNNSRKRKLKLISHDKFLLKFFIHFLKKIRPLDVYKAKGIRLKGEVFITKVGKKSMY